MEFNENVEAFNLDGNIYIYRNEWKRIYTEDGVLLFEGFTVLERPCGSGTVYFPDGKKYQEGVFGFKGLQVGREYYPNGNPRFEGLYCINNGYGPNYPRVGTVYRDDGQAAYEGVIHIRRSGLGYPLTDETYGFGRIVQKEAPEYPWLMWQHVRANPDAANPKD